ncbi:MAG TPA: energy-coupling factor transporter ATPase [Clostridiales bacterium]|nr:energy-coupling factor transporter ATPase [Clostridiales bacterium]
MPIIKVENLSYTYGEGTPYRIQALSDINLEILKGEIVGVIGHTGSGKSTLIQHLNGLLKPTSGKIYLEGKDIWAEPKRIRELRFKVGLVFQYPEYQLFEETVYKDIAFGPRNMGLDEPEIDKRVREAAHMVGLPEQLLAKSPFDLSGGEKRRAAIAGVMAMRPEVLVLDEPTAGLDPSGSKLILERICEYRQKYNSTVIVVSHNMEDIAKISDRVLVMNKGKIFMFDKSERIFARVEELLNIGLNVPQVTQVFIKLNKLGLVPSSNVYTIEQAKSLLIKQLSRRGTFNA